MIDKEAAELRRRFTTERSNIRTVCGAYINVHGEIVSSFRHALHSLPIEVQEKYLELLKKAISGSVGRSLNNLSFTTAQVADSDEHRLLSRLRSTELQDDEALDTLYHKIAASLHLPENYLVLLACESYDVPFRAKDGMDLSDAGDTVYSYFLCSICPVKETKPVLLYDAQARDFCNRGTDWVVANPELGFLFPAFDDRAANLYGVLYYTRSADNSYPDFVDALFHTQPPMAVTEQREAFGQILTEALEEECSVAVVQRVHSQLREIAQAHKEAKIPEPAAVTRQEIGAVLHSCGVSDEKMAAFNVKYDAAFGTDAAMPPQNLLNARQLEYRTPQVRIQVDPDRQDLISSRTVGGVHRLIINADEGVEINGVAVRFGEEQDGQGQ